MNFKEYLKQLDEAKEPYSISIAFNVDVNKLGVNGMQNIVKSKFGDNCKVALREYKADFKKGYKMKYEIIPEDKSVLKDKALLDDFKKIIFQTFNRNEMKAPEFKFSILKLDSSLTNIFPDTPLDKAYKKVFGKNSVDVGTTFNGGSNVKFKVSNIISNEMIMITMISGSGGRYQSECLLVKGEGAFTEGDVPAEYKKYF